MSKSHKSVYADERTHMSESEAHQQRRETQRHLDELMSADLIDQWDDSLDEIPKFEKIKRTKKRPIS